MAFVWLFDREKMRLQRRARDLCAAITRVARQPEFYGASAVPDTLNGRLELLMLHAALVMLRLQAQPEEAGFSQIFVDRVFKSFDEGLREAGVGDLTVPKSMRRIAGRFYERLQAYQAALAPGHLDGLTDALQANIWRGAPSVFAQPLALYAQAALAHLQDNPTAQMHEFSCWPPIPSPSEAVAPGPI